MALTAAKFNNVYVGYCQVMTRNGSGYPTGVQTDPDNMVVNTTSSALLLDSIIEMTPGNKTNPVVTNQGGQEIRSKTILPAQDFGTPTFSLSERNETLDALLTNSANDSTYNARRMIRGANMNQKTFLPFMVMFSILGTDSTTMASWWDNYCYLNCRIRRTGEGGAGQITGDATNPNPFAYALDLSLGTRDITGTLLSALTVSVDENIDAVSYQRTSYPLGVTTYLANGAATTFTLGYRPLNSDATGAANNNHTLNGTQATVTSASTTTGVVTLTGAGSSSDMHIMTYETEFVAI